MLESRRLSATPFPELIVREDLFKKPNFQSEKNRLGKTISDWYEPSSKSLTFSFDPLDPGTVILVSFYLWLIGLLRRDSDWNQG